MPTAVSDEAEYINKESTYIMRVSSCLINRQKAIVNVMGIKPFFNVIVIHEVEMDHFGYLKWSKWSKSFRPLKVKSRNGLVRMKIMLRDYINHMIKPDFCT